jgi:hypothetical protein
MRSLCGLTLGELIDWVVLLRALSLKVPRRSWREVARRVGKSAHGLDGICVRLLGVKCEDAAKLGLHPVTVFTDRVLRPLGLDDAA